MAMAAPAPVEVGAQGTVGSLVLREVEYFRRVDGGGGHGKKSNSKVAAAGSGGSPRSSNSSKKKNQNSPRNKKKSSSGGGGSNGGSFLPRMCSSAEVAEDPGSGGRRERPARIRYRPLGDEGDALHPEED